MARKRSPRGRGARQLPPIRSTGDEIKWATVNAMISRVSVVEWQRSKLFADMPEGPLCASENCLGAAAKGDGTFCGACMDGGTEDV